METKNNMEQNNKYQLDIFETNMLNKFKKFLSNIFYMPMGNDGLFKTVTDLFEREYRENKNFGLFNIPLDKQQHLQYIEEMENGNRAYRMRNLLEYIEQVEPVETSRKNFPAAAINFESIKDSDRPQIKLQIQKVKLTPSDSPYIQVVCIEPKFEYIIPERNLIITDNNEINILPIIFYLANRETLDSYYKKELYKRKIQSISSEIKFKNDNR